MAELPCFLTYMRVKLYGTVHFQQRQIVFEGSRIVLTMHNDALDILGDRTLALQIAGDVELAHDGNQASQEAAEEGGRLVRDYTGYMKSTTYPG